MSKKDTRPTADAAARRLMVLRQVVVYAMLAPPRETLAATMENWGEEERRAFETDAVAKRDKFWGRLRTAELYRDLSVWERDYVFSTIANMTDHQQRIAGWRLESVQTLAWALGLMETLPPYDTPADAALLKGIPPQSVTEFLASAMLRPAKELDQERDRAELWHWRSRTRQIIEEGEPLQPDAHMAAKGFRTYDDIVRRTAHLASEQGLLPTIIAEDFPVRGEAYRALSPEVWSEVQAITVERHHALNWLCGMAPDNNWDDTPTDT